MKVSLVQISPKLHYTNVVANMLATPPADETPTILQHVVGNNFTTNGQNFFTSQHLDMSRCWAQAAPQPNNVVEQRPTGMTVLTT